jgi:hypothetical protein
MRSSATISPQKRERYAQWLRNTGVEHPSDELIDRTRDWALLQIGNAKDKTRRSRLALAVLIFCSLVLAVYVWLNF